MTTSAGSLSMRDLLVRDAAHEKGTGLTDEVKLLLALRWSPQNWEDEMGDPVALDADRRVAEQDVL